MKEGMREREVEGEESKRESKREKGKIGDVP